MQRYKTSAKRRARRSAFSREREREKKNDPSRCHNVDFFPVRKQNFNSILPCPTQRVLNCSSRCSPPLELRSRSIASRLARSRVRRRTRPSVARLAFLIFDDDLIDWFSFVGVVLPFVCSLVCRCWDASAFCFFWNEEEEEEEKKNKKKWWETDKKKREKPKKKFRNWCTNFITHKCEHLIFKRWRTFNVVFEKKLKYLFFCSSIRAQIDPISWETTSVSNATYRVMCA